jgi:IclR family acetate operon transcriptional repressor
MDVTERVVAVVSYLAADDKIHGVTEIGDRLGISKSTVHRILSSLERMQWVERDPETRKYRLGSQLMEIGLSVLSRLDIRSISLPYLSQLTRSTNETSMLSLRVGYERVYIEQLEGSYEVRMIPALGKRHPLWCGAGGKAILAYLDESEIEKVIGDLRESGAQFPGSGRKIKVDVLMKELAEIRRQGFAMSFQERVSGAASVSAPIFGRDNRVTGSLTIAGHLDRFTDQVTKEYAALVTQAVREINSRIGSIRAYQNENI